MIVATEEDVQKKLDSSHELYASDYHFLEKKIRKEVETMQKEATTEGVGQCLERSLELVRASEELELGKYIFPNVTNEIEFLVRKIHEWREEGLRAKAVAFAATAIPPSRKEQKRKPEKKNAGGEHASTNATSSSVPNPAVFTEGATAPSSLNPAPAPITVSSDETFLAPTIANHSVPAPPPPQLHPQHAHLHAAGTNTALSRPAAGHVSPAPPADSALVVEIGAIPTLSLTELRLHLLTSLIEDADEWEIRTADDTAARVRRRVREVVNDLNSTLFQCEGRAKECEEAYRKRIGGSRGGDHWHIMRIANLLLLTHSFKLSPMTLTDELSESRIAHENEARLILFKMSSARDTYAAAVSGIEKLSADYDTNTMTPMLDRLQKARTREQAQRIKDEHDEALTQHVAALKEALSTAKTEFDDTRHALRHSRAKHHPEAWRIVREANAARSDGLAALDDWRDAFNDRIAAVQNETANASAKVTEEFAAHMEDLALIESAGRLLGSMRTRIKSEIIRCESMKKAVEKEVTELVHFRDYETVTWDRIQAILDKLDRLRESIWNYGSYLDCIKPGLKLVSDPAFPSGFEAWKTATKAPETSSRVSSARTRRSSSANRRSGTSIGLASSPSTPIASTSFWESSESFSGSSMGMKEITELSDGTGSFTQNLEAAKNTIRASAIELCESYFRNKGMRAIRRTAEIPPNWPGMVNYNDVRLSLMRETAEGVKSGHVEDFATLLSRVSDETRTIFHKIFQALLRMADQHTQRLWEARIQRFVNARPMSLSGPGSSPVRPELRMVLGHPRWTKDLDALDFKQGSGGFLDVVCRKDRVGGGARVVGLIFMQTTRSSRTADSLSSIMALAGDPSILRPRTVKEAVDQKQELATESRADSNVSSADGVDKSRAGGSNRRVKSPPARIEMFGASPKRPTLEVQVLPFERFAGGSCPQGKSKSAVELESFLTLNKLSLLTWPIFVTLLSASSARRLFGWTGLPLTFRGTKLQAALFQERDAAFAAFAENICRLHEALRAFLTLEKQEGEMRHDDWEESVRFIKS
ncbi:hypothetical protein BDK51DRAFT_39495 [Blyttiomyces helicus]|uniref:Uncharacterized protein n=1 Tax=Blyttiomyces helicus TaxID=388810 RepID=A0A4P9W7J3_9FUNG|nr:hypothetical protein BDK51DRAFT_39495 [Blyttiomyces helicus]|eukprot:RKO88439.1 hypothetical protein BDK51DRAFT_39495 [Blyttiomyces helicus]